MSNEAKAPEELVKRTEVYVRPPAAFDISGCKCGNTNPQWSEWQKRLWCEKCQIDFEPEHWGILDGPIGINVAMLMGYNFDMERLSDHVLLVMNPQTCEYEEEKKPCH